MPPRIGQQVHRMNTQLTRIETLRKERSEGCKGMLPHQDRIGKVGCMETGRPTEDIVVEWERPHMGTSTAHREPSSSAAELLRIVEGTAPHMDEEVVHDY